ncbi:hypothetical protein [Kitasatospora sp. NPDC097643]|uniref:hypothetical protein n=1 Tax=Kitasatospora sp. NPDC097643 TaxID=3157230 RepID=UPI0033228ECD
MLPLFPLIAAALTLPLVLGVVLPAVWSRQPARRTAARAVLRMLLDAVRRRG